MIVRSREGDDPQVDGGVGGARTGRQLTDSVEVLYVHATIKLKVVQRVSRETEAVREERRERLAFSFNFSTFPFILNWV
jgi:hypothetical protein